MFQNSTCLFLKDDSKEQTILTFLVRKSFNQLYQIIESEFVYKILYLSLSLLVAVTLLLLYRKLFQFV